MIRVLLLLLCTLVSGVSYSESLSSKQDVKALSDEIMAQMAKGNTVAGIELTKPYLVIPEHEYLSLLEKMKLHQPAMEQRFGRTVGVEFIGETEVGESLILIQYFQKFEKHLLHWKLYFYKANDEWMLNSFFYDDQITNMFLTP